MSCPNPAINELAQLLSPAVDRDENLLLDIGRGNYESYLRDKFVTRLKRNAEKNGCVYVRVCVGRGQVCPFILGKLMEDVVCTVCIYSW